MIVLWFLFICSSVLGDSTFLRLDSLVNHNLWPCDGTLFNSNPMLVINEIKLYLRGVEQTGLPAPTVSSRYQYYYCDCTVGDPYRSMDGNLVSSFLNDCNVDSAPWLYMDVTGFHFDSVHIWCATPHLVDARFVVASTSDATSGTIQQSFTFNSTYASATDIPTTSLYVFNLFLPSSQPVPQPSPRPTRVVSVTAVTSEWTSMTSESFTACSAFASTSTIADWVSWWNPAYVSSPYCLPQTSSLTQYNTYIAPVPYPGGNTNCVMFQQMASGGSSGAWDTGLSRNYPVASGSWYAVQFWVTQQDTVPSDTNMLTLLLDNTVVYSAQPAWGWSQILTTAVQATTSTMNLTLIAEAFGKQSCAIGVTGISLLTPSMPSGQPSASPSVQPSVTPSSQPVVAPSSQPTRQTRNPTSTARPIPFPSVSPSSPGLSTKPRRQNDWSQQRRHTTVRRSGRRVRGGIVDVVVDVDVAVSGKRRK